MPLIFLVLLLTFVNCERQSARQTTATDSTRVYQYRDAGRDGIGKVYMGREIAQVMGHLGASWLERPEREQEERTDLLLKALDLKPTDVVADIGAGTGYFTFRIAPAVPQGRVLAVDIQPEMIDYLNAGKRKNKTANVEAVLGTIDNPKLPPTSIDVALLVDAYHEFSHPQEMMQHIVQALKPGGRVVLVEYRAEDPNVPIKPLHKLSVAQATREMKAVGLRLLRVDKSLPQQHILFFGKE
ncbi:class I SAM-dependent methyltransferase [Nibrella viscosa]|uniref:Class I SAM-dependent methyltransferase n=1 Tax=Nibrella viscosa TaxID=1084524 RepID=A0ABP8KH87_9BACT